MAGKRTRKQAGTGESAVVALCLPTACAAATAGGDVPADCRLAAQVALQALKVGELETQFAELKRQVDALLAGGPTSTPAALRSLDA